MKILYIPLYRMGVRYAISFGRRGSLLEQMILIDLVKERRSLAQLAEDAELPERLVIEALINLLRTGWIEIRATNSGVLFTATLIGKRRATEENLPAQLQKDFRWISLDVDRITGSWFRAEDLDLVYQRDLPEDAYLIEPKIHTYNPLDASLRDLVNLAPHEGFEASEPVFRNPSRPYARVRVAFDRVEGLPGYAPLSLHQALFTAALEIPDLPSAGNTAVISPPSSNLPRDSIREDDIIVGGEAHLAFLENCLSTAKTHVILHSCFVHPDTIARLLPALQQAGKRRVRVDLLWGLHSDPEDPSSRRPIIQATAVLDRLPTNTRTYIQLSPISSGSHAKVLIYDNRSEE